jgi:hypothetical protein
VKESEIQTDIRIELGTLEDVRLFRNNCGVLIDARGERVAYGLCKGSADLIGFRTIQVTPEMVGTLLAVFAAIEVKAPGKRASYAQARFLSMVNDAGGLAGVATSVDEAKEILEMT